MKNREERPTNLDRGATQQTFDFGNEVDDLLPANFPRQEVTDPAFADTPSLSVSPDADLLEQIVDPENLARAWSRVKRNRGAPGRHSAVYQELTLRPVNRAVARIKWRMPPRSGRYDDP